jgi:hypothetical protein
LNFFQIKSAGARSLSLVAANESELVCLLSLDMTAVCLIIVRDSNSLKMWLGDVQQQ